MKHDVGGILVNTVDSDKSKYSVRQYSNAKKAYTLQDTIGRPSTEDFMKYVQGNMVPNCNITRQDILRTEDIFGPNLGNVTHTCHMDTSTQGCTREIKEHNSGN